jgi:hypothetical protein
MVPLLLALKLDLTTKVWHRWWKLVMVRLMEGLVAITFVKVDGNHKYREGVTLLHLM